MQERELQSILICILRSELTCTPLDEDTKKDLNSERIAALYKLSKAHDLAHIVSASLGKLGLLNQDEISAKFQKQEMLSVYRCEQIKYELDHICKTLDDAAISYIPLKGSVIRRYYPYESMRTSCDIDVLVKEEQLEKAENIIVEKLLYKNGSKGEHDIAFNAPSGVHFELHFSLIEGDVRIDDTLSRVWDYAIQKQSTQYYIQKDFLLFYHMAHMAKHFSHGGCGIRPFMDLWIMEHKMEINRQACDALLSECGLDKFARAAFALTDVWFAEGEHTALTLNMQDYIMNAGVYGTLENYITVSQTKKGNNIKHLFSKIFLTYPQMKVYYPSVKKFPILFPFYQVRRWFKIATRKNGAKNAIEHIKISNSVSEERRDYIKNLCNELGI